jgi:hypothetical protein
MAQATCPSCGAPGVESDAACLACRRGEMSTTPNERGMMVAGGGGKTLSASATDRASGSGHDQLEARVTTVSHPQESKSEPTAGRSELPEPASPAPDAPGARARFADLIGGLRSGTDKDTASRAALNHRRRVAMVALVLLALMGAVLVAGTGNRPKGAVARTRPPAATATPSPTATATPSPSPSPGLALMPGYAAYTDPNAQYSLQYPATWTRTQEPNLGVDFADTTDPTASKYELQVYQPDPRASNVPSQSDDNTTAASWVNFELVNFQQTEIAHGFTFQRMPGPIPAATFGGQTWQTGIAFISGQNGQDLKIQVQVYATIHNGKPYVVNLLAAADAFQQGQQRFFTPMLDSFQFLPASP